ncbi:uncharacterized protein EKO05_0003518 [Ascochyta rabiei]|uniref:uncharacterized protein n=1 Tax=Didymella rabiei TaxID=5454 RepID=UPI0019021765|nr:uncharacterized protein EKO05_0003518 [Ascochyta rabiei]UPX12988.1 hypothetical protein EKO05_0003518 [Ascochyta rabiei]
MDGGESAYQNDAPPPRSSVYRKLTLTVECDALLKPAAHRPELHTSKTGEECVAFFRMENLPTAVELDRIKVRCFHTCAGLRVEGESCLDALWKVGDCLMERYQALGRSVRCERIMAGDGRD